MAPRRTRVDEGIYQDAWGLAATVKVGRRQVEERFPPGTSFAFIQNWRDRTRADLREERDDAADDAAPVRGTFAGDLPRYLKLIEGRPSYKSDRSHLQAWLPFVGHMRRQDIRPAQVKAAFVAWLKAGKSARTIRHRRRVLRELYAGLDGDHARPPLKGVKAPRPPDSHPTPVSHATIERVARSLRAGLRIKQACGPTRKKVMVQRAESPQTYARYLVRATTGQRPGQIMAATPSDVDLVRRIWYVRPAKGGRPIPMPLNDAMYRAWRIFRWVKAWGKFDVRSFSKTLRRHGWPKNVRPYNLRHTFAIDLLLDGADLGDVQGLLGHKQIETTRRHYAPILLARLRKAVLKRKLAV